MVRKVVIPVAGSGTRFLPYTKAIPKPMLPVVDKPVIQYLVEEAVEAGIEEVVLVTGYSKRAVEDHFDVNLELEYLLEKAGKREERALVRDLSNLARFVYIRQGEPMGNGHAILQARDVIGDEPFLVVFGDDLFAGGNRLKAAVEAHEQYGDPVIFAHPATRPGDGSRYGYLALGERLDDVTSVVSGFAEKPGDDNRPSDYANLGAMLLTPDIFRLLETQQAGTGGEIWLSDAVKALAQQRRMLARTVPGLRYYDCGNKVEYLKAVVEFALAREDIGPGFRDYLRSLPLD